MAFMFKGPAALTTGSTVTAAGASTFASTVGITGNTTVGGTFGVTGAATLSSTLSTGGITITSGTLTPAAGGIVFPSGSATNIDPGTGGADSDSVVLASRKYVTQNAGSGDTVLANVTTMSTPGVYNSVSIDSNNVINFANTADTTAAQITGTLALGSVVNGKKLFVSWAAKNAAHISLKVDFGTNKLYDAAGNEARYLTFSNVGASILMFYSVVDGSGHWIISGSGATPSTS